MVSAVTCLDAVMFAVLWFAIASKRMPGVLSMLVLASFPLSLWGCMESVTAVGWTMASEYHSYYLCRGGLVWTTVLGGACCLCLAVAYTVCGMHTVAWVAGFVPFAII